MPGTIPSEKIPGEKPMEFTGEDRWAQFDLWQKGDGRAMEILGYHADGKCLIVSCRPTRH